MKKNEVYNCFEYAFRCPRTWESFADTAERKVKFCDECQKHVYLCETPEELKENVNRLFCVAFPPAGLINEQQPATETEVETPLPPGMMMPLEYPFGGFASIYLETDAELDQYQIDYLAWSFKLDKESLKNAHRTGETITLNSHIPKETAESISERLKSRNIPHRLELLTDY